MSIKFDGTEYKSIQYNGMVYLKLEYLGIEDFKEIENLFNLTELEWLSLSGNNLTYLPDDIDILQNLKILSLGSNRIKFLPDTLCNLENLKELNLHHNDIIDLPDEFGNLKKLEILRLGDNKLEKLPDSFKKLLNLKKLFLDRNNLTESFDNLGYLVSLNDLWINENHLNSISLRNLINLKSLWLRGNKIQTLPEELGNLVNLETLILDHNKIREIPDSIGNLQKLKTLNFSDNFIQELPSTFGNLINLKSLVVNGNSIKNLPLSFGSLKNLGLLYLEENCLENLPISFFNLIKLQRLNLNRNNFSLFPENISLLTNIWDLEFGFNFEHDPPNWVKNLPNLRKFRMYNNRISYRMFEMVEFYLKNLMKIENSSNILNESNRSILINLNEYIRKTRSLMLMTELEPQEQVNLIEHFVPFLQIIMNYYNKTEGNESNIESLERLISDFSYLTSEEAKSIAKVVANSSEIAVKLMNTRKKKIAEEIVDFYNDNYSNTLTLIDGRKFRDLLTIRNEYLKFKKIFSLELPEDFLEHYLKILKISDETWQEQQLPVEIVDGSSNDIAHLILDYAKQCNKDRITRKFAHGFWLERYGFPYKRIYRELRLKLKEAEGIAYKISNREKS